MIKYTVETEEVRSIIECETVIELLQILEYVTSAESEWIEWGGGECPVPDNVPTTVRFRSGEERTDDDPQGWLWSHISDDTDIVAYKVVK